MMIDHLDLIEKLPAMLQGRKTFAKMDDGGNYHIGNVEDWWIMFSEIEQAIKDYCRYKKTGEYNLSAPVNGNWDVLNAYKVKGEEDEHDSF